MALILCPVIAVVGTVATVLGRVDSNEHRADGLAGIGDVGSASIASILESLRERSEPWCTDVGIWHVLCSGHVCVNEKWHTASDESTNIRAGGVVVAEAAALKHRPLIDADVSAARCHRVSITCHTRAELQHRVVWAALRLAECEADSHIRDLLTCVGAQLWHHAADVA